VPTQFFSGPATFTYKVFDGAFFSNTATVTITVSAVGQPPVANNDNYSVNNNGTLTVPAPGVLGNDTDPNSDPLTALASTGPNGLVIGPNHGTLTLNANGSFTYVPRPFFNGTDSFTYRASDTSNLSNLATVTITVNAVNVAPQATGDTFFTATNTPLPGELRCPGLGAIRNRSEWRRRHGLDCDPANRLASRQYEHSHRATGQPPHHRRRILRVERDGC
jgi:hypothetical protein